MKEIYATQSSVAFNFSSLMRCLFIASLFFVTAPFAAAGSSDVYTSHPAACGRQYLGCYNVPLIEGGKYTLTFSPSFRQGTLIFTIETPDESEDQSATVSLTGDVTDDPNNPDPNPTHVGHKTLTSTFSGKDSNGIPVSGTAVFHFYGQLPPPHCGGRSCTSTWVLQDGTITANE